MKYDIWSFQKIKFKPYNCIILGMSVVICACCSRMGVSKVPAFASACLHSLLLLNLNPLFHGLARHLIKQPPYFYFLFFFLVEVLTLSCPCTFNLKQNLCTTFNLNKIYSSFQCMNKHDKSSISLALIGAT